MNDQDKERMVRAIGGMCGSLTCASAGFVVFVVALSVATLYYEFEVWAVVSIMVGIAVASLLARVQLLLSHCRDCVPNDIFGSISKYLLLFCALGLVTGLILPLTYNADYPHRMCAEAPAVPNEEYNEYMIEGCKEFRHNVQLLLDVTLAIFPLTLIVITIVDGRLRFRRLDRSGTATG